MTVRKGVGPKGVGQTQGSDSFEFAIVLDFEATCAKHKAPQPQEIIEFPSVVLSLTTLEVTTEFESFVRPVEHPILTDFCTGLTSISQRQVDAASPFSKVMQSYEAWLDEHGLNERNALLVTCGDWDLKTMLPKQCGTSHIHPRSIFLRWMNIKKVYKDVMGERARGMIPMLSALEIPLVGTHHRGIDDSRNIAQILRVLLAKGAVFGPTS